MAEFTEEIKAMIWTAAHTVPAVDPRTLLTGGKNAPADGGGVDGLLTSTEILAEFFRRRGAPGEAAGATGEQIMALAPGELADLVWRQLFIEHPPLSEATRRVLTTMGLFGLDVGPGDLRLLREQFAAIPMAERREKALRLANLGLVLHPVDAMEPEAPPPPAAGPAFRPVLCLTRLLGDWKESARILRQRGFGLKARVDGFGVIELRRWLAGEAARVNPAALSLDWPDGAAAGDDGVGRLVREAVLPLCRERGTGVMLSPAGTAIDVLAPLWEANPEVRFLLFPAGAEQLPAALEEAARRRNVLLCGPDRELAYPAGMEEYTARRLEALGSAFHYAHSGAEGLTGLVGTWAHLRWNLGRALLTRYAEMWRTGWRYGEGDIRREAEAVLGGNVRKFLNLQSTPVHTL